jgi:hypothetical protein
MGFLDKMKGAVGSMTGGNADVSIEYPMEPVRQGDNIHVKVTVMSTGAEVKSNGVYVDIVAKEHGQVVGSSRCEKCGDYDSSSRVKISNKTVDQSFPVAPAFVLQPNERKEFEADIQLPYGQPSYHGAVDHEWQIRGRLEAFGNDPDSGYKTFEVRSS